jgi:glucan biosynthesis protein C
MNPSSPDTGTRLYFLDWHVKSASASDALQPLMMISSPWRLGLLFLISGVASSFMLAKIGAARFMNLRSSRLLIPLLFGMLVIVPPQPYFEVIEKMAYQGSYLDFMKLYLSAYQDFCRAADCLVLPTWNHLWFVAYLWVYTLVLGALVLALGVRFDALSQRVASWLTGWKIIGVFEVVRRCRPLQPLFGLGTIGGSARGSPPNAGPSRNAGVR